MLMNKRNSLKVQAEAYDMTRQLIWALVSQKRMKEKTAEKKLVDLDNSLKYNESMLHDILTGETAQYVEKIRSDGTVLLGHQAQGIYLSYNWEDIHELSRKIKEFVVELQKKKDKNKQELDMLLGKNLITKEDYDRYMTELNIKLGDDTQLRMEKEHPSH